MFIPDDEKENVYAYYKNYTLEEFEFSLLNDLLRYESECMTTNTSSIDKKVENKNDSKSIEMDIDQAIALPYDSYFHLYSTVFGIGTPIKYRYQSINGCNVTWPNGYTGYHFSLTSWTYTLNNNDQTCICEVYGVPKNAAGIILLVTKHCTLTFNAN